MCVFKQINTYLENNCKGRVPQNVLKQIRIWEEDKDSVKDIDALVLSEFAGEEITVFKKKLEAEDIPIIWQSSTAVAVEISFEKKVNSILEHLG